MPHVTQDDWVRIAARVALLGLLLGGPRALVGVFDWWRTGRAVERHGFIGCGLLGLALRLAVPERYVQIFTGYGLIHDIVRQGPLPKYGAGQGALLGGLFGLFGPDENLVFALQAGLGLLTLVLLAIVVGRWLDAPRAAVTALAGLVLLPLLVRHHRSEASGVMADFAVVLALFHWQAARLHGQWRDGWLAVLAWAFACHVRPEMLLVGPVLGVLAWRWHPGASATSLGPRAWLAPVAAGSLLVAPQAVHVLHAWQAQSAAGDVASAAGWLAGLVQLPVLHLAFWPHVFPLAATGLGLWLGRRAWQRPRAAGLVRWTLAAQIVLLVPVLLDPVTISLPRLQALPLALWLATTLGLLALQVPVRSKAFVTAWLALLASMAATVPWLWQPDNADREDAILHEAADLLAGQAGVLYTLTYDDAGTDKVSRHLPIWRFGPPRARLSVRPLRDLQTGARSDEPGWVLLPLRCHARARRLDEAAPAVFEHAACKSVRALRGLAPLKTWTVANEGDVSFPWWPAQASLQAGLYRLDPGQP